MSTAVNNCMYKDMRKRHRTYVQYHAVNELWERVGIGVGIGLMKCKDIQVLLKVGDPGNRSGS